MFKLDISKLNITYVIIEKMLLIYLLKNINQMIKN